MYSPSIIINVAIIYNQFETNKLGPGRQIQRLQECNDYQAYKNLAR